MIRAVKEEIRILGIDDSPFEKFKRGKKVLVIGCVFRAGKWLDGVVSTYVSCDGTNSTKKLTSLINKTKHKKQLRVIMISGISLGGFNIVDIKELSQKTKLPVIVVTRRKPNFKNIKHALKHFKDWKNRWKNIEKAGEVYEIKIKKSKVYYQVCDIPPKTAEKIIKLSATHSTVPEPLRIAHLIAGGVVLGESTGRV